MLMIDHERPCAVVGVVLKSGRVVDIANLLDAYNAQNVVTCVGILEGKVAEARDIKARCRGECSRNECGRYLADLEDERQALELAMEVPR